jgi:hypothetical protein
MTDDFLRYYDLEAYLFQDVAQRFQKDGKLDAFDLFSISSGRQNEPNPNWQRD